MSRGQSSCTSLISSHYGVLVIRFRQSRSVHSMCINATEALEIPSKGAIAEGKKVSRATPGKQTTRIYGKQTKL